MVAGEGVVDGGWGVGAVHGYGGDVAADGVPVVGDLPGGEQTARHVFGDRERRRRMLGVLSE